MLQTSKSSPSSSFSSKKTVVAEHSVVAHVIDGAEIIECWFFFKEDLHFEFDEGNFGAAVHIGKMWRPCGEDNER